MNWEDLEKLTGKYRDRFDKDEPSADHLASFEAKLQQRFKGSYMLKRQTWFRVAASIAILVIGTCLSYLIYDYTRLPKINNNNNNNNTFQTVSELRETEIYYTKQINKGMEQIQSLKIPDQRQKTAILSDLNGMDKNYDQLKRDLKNNPDDERLVHAIIQHYQIKLEAIDQVINSISFSQNNLKPQS